MVILYKFPRIWGLPCMSPYAMKVEAYLRLRGIEHQVRVGDPRKAPRGKLPWVETDGQLLGDSTLILDHFEGRHAKPLNAALSRAQLARGWTLTRTLEESTVWALRHQRFIDPSGWPATRLELRAMLPPLVRAFAPQIIRRQMRGQLWAQGLGRLTPDQMHGMASRDFDAAAAMLGDGPYLFGESVSSFDLTLFAFVTSFSCATARSPVTEHLLALPNLISHCERLRERLYPEFPSWVASPLPAARLQATQASPIRS